MKFYYFVSFMCRWSDHTDYGNCNFDTKIKISTAKEIADIQDGIAKSRGVESVLITNIVLLDSRCIIK